MGNNFNPGISKHPAYPVWMNMRNRCFNPDNLGYKNYGGRGITVCDLWENSSMAFINWCEDNGYKKGLEIDRINNNGNYEPSNCRFVTRKVNSRNRRDSTYIKYAGYELVLFHWAKIIGISQPVLRERVVIANWSINRSIETSTPKQTRYSHNGQQLTLIEIQKLTGENLLKLFIQLNPKTVSHNLTSKFGAQQNVI